MKRILIIDDEKDFCHMVKVNLQGLGDYEVRVANSGPAGLQAASADRPDLVLLDIMMPGMDGLEVLKRLKQNLGTLHIPVLMLTAVKDSETKEKAVRLYDEGYIEKPIQMEELKARIDKALSKIKKP